MDSGALNINGDISGVGFKNTNPTNLLTNGSFENWSSGTAVAPDGWIGGTVGGGSTSREGSIVKLGSYSLRIISIAGTGNYTVATQDIHSARGIAYWQNRVVTFGCWVYLSGGSSLSIIINDGVGESSTSISTGLWQWLSVTRTISASATKVQAKIYGGSSGVTAYFDGAILVEGSNVFAFTPSPQDSITGVVDRKTFNSSGTWYKPATGTMAYIQVWGGGGSGGKGAASGPNGGGGGGAYNERWIQLSAVNASETVTVGAGGAAQTSASTVGNAGGTSSFGTSPVIYAYGGGGGGNNAAGGGGGGGGGQTAAGAVGSVAVGGAGGASVIAGGTGGSAANGGDVVYSGGGGGGGGNTASVFRGGHSWWGGGGGGGGQDTTGNGTGAGGNSMWGGGGGGGGANTTTPGPAGTSVYGGNGSAGVIDAGVSADGTAPGGGSGGTEGGNSGKGGDGRVVITVF